MTSEELLAAIEAGIDDPIKRTRLLKRAIMKAVATLSQEELQNIYNVMEGIEE